MTAPVVLVDPGTLDGVATGDVVTVSGAEARHVIAVRRMTAGERIDVVDGTGTRARGTIASVDTGLAITVDEVSADPEPRPTVVLVQAIPKGDRAELAVEVATEVGVDEIVPWAAQRCVAVWRGDRAVKSHARWLRVAAEASKQSRRARIPRIHPLAGLREVTEMVADAVLAVVLDEGATVPIGSVVPPTDGTVVIVVGPEGGVTDEERTALVEAGATAVRLGPSVLRTSTAGVVGAGILLSRTGRWTADVGGSTP